MPQPWARIVNSTIKNYIRTAEDNTLRNRKLSALIKKRGRITYNWGGTAMDWKVKYNRVKPSTYDDGDILEFSKKERYRTATLDWRGYTATDGMSKKEFLMNRGKEAIIKVWSEMATGLMDDIEEQFGEEFYVDGYAAGNSKRIMGIESFMQATANPGNGAASPTGTFAGLSCVPGAFGGTWNGGPYNALTNNGWPNGRGDVKFDFWSPIIVDYGDHLFPGDYTASQNNWETNCVEAISYGIIKSKKSKSKKGKLDLITVDEDMYRLYLKRQRSLQRIQVVSTTAEEKALGFEDTINQDGTDITWEYGSPAGVGYGWNVDNMELRSMQAQVFVPAGPDQDIATKAWRISIDFFGNMVWNPKFQVKFAQLTAVGS